MKAWKKGAIIGGAIGLLRVMDFIFYPIIGAVIGAVLIQSIYTFITTTKMELWQKAGIVGAIVGTIYGLIVPIIGTYVAMAHEATTMGTPIIFRPSIFTFTSLFTNPEGGYSFIIALVLNGIIWIIINTLLFYKIVTVIKKR